MNKDLYTAEQVEKEVIAAEGRGERLERERFLESKLMQDEEYSHGPIDQMIADAVRTKWQNELRAKLRELLKGE